ncbi:hypothetical protein DBR17_03880 [Sphingomonas sp. HMWF008]|nr:hypothetical protein DBR17_03880 [Sphingomonas sp. HMWF008]
MEAASNQIVVQANGLPVPQRKARRQTLRNLATRLKQEASTNFGNGTIASGLGFLGGSLVVGVLLVSGPVTIPLIAIGGCGAVTLFGGVGTALVLNRAANNQMHQAGLIENIIAEIDL